MLRRHFVMPVIAAATVLCAGAASAARQGSGAVSGTVATYTVAPGDSWTSIGARFGVYPSTLALDNHLDIRRTLHAGVELRIDNRHIVPATLATGEILINVPQKMAFYEEGGRVFAYPISVGRTTWQTPAGPFTVIRKEENPAWHVPESIRAESARMGRTLPLVVPPGPRNPLGGFWIGLSLAGIGIHGTPLQSSIFQAATHGCIRLRRDEIADLYSRVAVGTRGELLYEPILIAVGGDGIYLEVHPDVYSRLRTDAHQHARDLAARLDLSDRIDWTRADREIDRRAGIARRVSPEW